ncbi:putative dNA polymerase III, delta' subunit [Neisseria meningitidis NM151]|nr:putative dNA polymerase III, delta' subunit [Neisseria meningitidis NM151]
MIYPWHNEQWRQIAEHWERRPNAWLFAGKKDTGKKALLCETPAPGLYVLHLFGQGSHPDFYEIPPCRTNPKTDANCCRSKSMPSGKSSIMCPDFGTGRFARDSDSSCGKYECPSRQQFVESVGRTAATSGLFAGQPRGGQGFTDH